MAKKDLPKEITDALKEGDKIRKVLTTPDSKEQEKQASVSTTTTSKKEVQKAEQVEKKQVADTAKAKEQNVPIVVKNTSSTEEKK